LKTAEAIAKYRKNAKKKAGREDPGCRGQEEGSKEAAARQASSGAPEGDDGSSPGGSRRSSPPSGWKDAKARLLAWGKQTPDHEDGIPQGTPQGANPTPQSQMSTGDRGWDEMGDGEPWLPHRGDVLGDEVAPVPPKIKKQLATLDGMRAGLLGVQLEDAGIDNTLEDIRDAMEDVIHDGGTAVGTPATDKTDFGDESGLRESSFQTPAAGNQTPRRLAFAALDTDHDGLMSPKEWLGRSHPRGGTTAAQQAAMDAFNRMDLNGDGYVGKDEWMAMQVGTASPEHPAEVEALARRTFQKLRGEMESLPIDVLINAHGGDDTGILRLLQTDSEGRVTLAAWEGFIHRLAELKGWAAAKCFLVQGTYSTHSTPDGPSPDVVLSKGVDLVLSLRKMRRKHQASP